MNPLNVAVIRPLYLLVFLESVRPALLRTPPPLLADALANEILAPEMLRITVLVSARLGRGVVAS